MSGHDHPVDPLDERPGDVDGQEQRRGDDQAGQELVAEPQERLPALSVAAAQASVVCSVVSVISFQPRSKQRRARIMP